MTPPTHEEIQSAYDKITADGSDALITEQLGVLAITDPLLRECIKRMVAAVLALRLHEREVTMEGTLSGALIYGLHMGIYIGQNRAHEGTL